MVIRGVIVSMFFFVAACGGSGGGGNSGTPPPVVEAQTATVLAVNDLGMHCMDREYSVFSILPPFNVVLAQVVKQDSNGRPYVADDAEALLFYESVADASGSLNSNSVTKTDFWTHANALFGINLSEGEGLTGLYMPADDPQMRGAQPLTYSHELELFVAQGIPITPTDDRAMVNPYPLMRISALDAPSGQSVGHVDTVVPVASETDCQSCHRTGAMAAEDAGMVWSTDDDLEIQSKINVLKLHDDENGTNLEASQPVLCARCHYSAALDLAGSGPVGEQVGNPNFSNVMHEFHGGLQENGQPVFPADAAVEATCYQCHPGVITQCQRGAMYTGGMDCNDCHGGMLAVGGTYPLLAGGSVDGSNDANARRPWLDLPRCQSCHTGDAVNHLARPNLVVDPDWPFRLRRAFTSGDHSATPVLATNKRFAEEPDRLFRFSKGHGDIACESCHGSTHAIWPNVMDSANDNVAARKLQGYAGTIIECVVCHEPGSLAATTGGPHGLHPVNDSRWFDDGHEDAYEADENNCKACHGLDLTGTPLSRVPTARRFRLEADTIAYAQDDLVRCDRCHGMPGH